MHVCLGWCVVGGVLGDILCMCVCHRCLGMCLGGVFIFVCLGVCVYMCVCVLCVFWMWYVYMCVCVCGVQSIGSFIRQAYSWGHLVSLKAPYDQAKGSKNTKILV